MGLDPVAAPGLAAAYDRASAELERQAGRVAALLAEAGQRGAAPVVMRAVAGDLRDGADEVRERALAVVDDAGRFFRELTAYLGGDVLGLWNGGRDESMPWGSWLAGTGREARMLRFLAAGGRVTEENVLPLFNNGVVGRSVQRLPGMGWLGRAGTSTVLRRAGMAGGLYTGVTATVDLIGQGDPVDAYRREGAGYVADVAGTAFGYSSALFLAAPTPATGALMVGTGVVWLGAEAWNHRDEIVDAWDGATDWAGDRLDGAARAVGGVAGDARDLAEGMADTLSFWN